MDFRIILNNPKYNKQFFETLERVITLFLDMTPEGGICIASETTGETEDKEDE